MSEWYRGELNLVTRIMVPSTWKLFTHVPPSIHWKCPKENCAGEMVFTGEIWPTGDPGLHHTCTVCSYTAAIKGHRYPEKVDEQR